MLIVENSAAVVVFVLWVVGFALGYLLRNWTEEKDNMKPAKGVLTPEELQLIGCYRSMGGDVNALFIDLGTVFAKASEKVSEWAEGVIADLEAGRLS